MTLDLQTAIEMGWENRASLSTDSADALVRDAVNDTIDALDTGRLRVAEKIKDAWVVHQWIKKAVLLSFRLNDNAIMGQPGELLELGGCQLLGTDVGHDA